MRKAISAATEMIMVDLHRSPNVLFANIVGNLKRIAIDQRVEENHRDENTIEFTFSLKNSHGDVVERRLIGYAEKDATHFVPPEIRDRGVDVILIDWLPGTPLATPVLRFLRRGGLIVDIVERVWEFERDYDPPKNSERVQKALGPDFKVVISAKGMVVAKKTAGDFPGILGPIKRVLSTIRNTPMLNRVNRLGHVQELPPARGNSSIVEKLGTSPTDTTDNELPLAPPFSDIKDLSYVYHSGVAITFSGEINGKTHYIKFNYDQELARREISILSELAANPKIRPLLYDGMMAGLISQQDTEIVSKIKPSLNSKRQGMENSILSLDNLNSWGSLG